MVVRNLIPSHSILKNAGTTVCEKSKMLLKGQGNISFGVPPGYLQVRERCWVRQEETTKKKHLARLPHPAPAAERKMPVHSHLTDGRQKAGELLSLVCQETTTLTFSHRLFMLFRVCGVVLHEQAQAVPFLFPRGVDPCRNWPLRILIGFFFPVDSKSS